jgi:ParB family chromosome partitioning protein
MVPVEEIKFFVRRARAVAPYSRLKESIKGMGLKIPISVRDISSLPRVERRRQDGSGGTYKYELICGQGRLQAFRELGLKEIPAVIHDIAEVEIVGRFLAENVMRKKLSWVEKGQLIKFDVDSGLSLEEIAKRYFITRNHVLKYLRTLKGASKEVIEQAKNNELSLNDAEVLTVLSPEEQNIVVDVLKDEGLTLDSLQPLVKMAKANPGKVSKAGLKEQIAALKRERRETRAKLKLYRQLHSLASDNLRQLLTVPEVSTHLDDLGVDYSEFLTAANA